MKKKTAALIAAALCALMLAALAACSAPAQSRSSESISAEATDVVASKEPPSTDPFYVLVVGNDSREGTIEITKDSYSDGLGRSDTMMFVRVDPQTYQLTLVTIPRDTAADFDGSEYKINEAYHLKGIDYTLDQVEALTGVRPKYYLDMGFVQFEKFIDLLGGVDVDVPIDMSLTDIVSGDDISLSAGEQTLNGPQALVLARVRKAFNNLYPSPEAQRQNDDRKIVIAGITKVANGGIGVDDALKALLDNCDTNFDTDDLTWYVEDFAKHADQISIYSGTGPYVGDMYGDIWLVPRDEDTWHELMSVVDAGGDPNDVVTPPSL